MVLVYDRALIARSSSDILFFKIEATGEGEERRRMWKQYEVIPLMGFIYYIKKNIRIQVTTADKIYFYIIDNDTLMPILENVMWNFMGCT